MTAFMEKHRRKIFWFIIAAAFVSIFAYNFLTLYMSDDYFYLIEVQKAENLFDLVKQQYGEYLSNSGRVIGQFNVRLSLVFDKQVFNVVNSLMFTGLVLLMYANIRRKRKHDILVLLLIITFLWKYAVDFGQTMLWICGACNYLWGSVIILGFVTFFRHLLDKAENLKHPVWCCTGTFLFAIAAGWCNENTSGGALLLVLLFGLNFWWDRRKEGKKALYPFMIAAVFGMCCGFLGMISAPGVRNRSQVKSEGEYTGLVGLLSRIYKISMSVKELFFTVLVIIVIVLVILALQKRFSAWKQIRSNETVLFLLSAIATCYALALAPTPMNRAFFGAGIFLFIACIQGIVDASEEEMTIRAAKYGLVSVLCLWFCFNYLENLVNLARIYREENARIEMIRADKADINGDGIVVVPKLREEFENPYSYAYASELEDDKDYWINIFYEIYYDVGNITAIPRDEWDELYGEEQE
ncbi:MAG: DUF6056 family protein [Bacillota bacterium]|nr:DUF6056 family protein [Bacillota bacterium]